MPYTDTNVNNLIINKMTREQYESLDSHSSSELYFITDDKLPAAGSSSVPVYVNANGEIVACSGSNIFSDLNYYTDSTSGSFDTKYLTLTIAGETKEIELMDDIHFLTSLSSAPGSSGIDNLTLGTNISSSYGNNGTTGSIYLYGSGTTYTHLIPSNPSQNIEISLPPIGGRLAVGSASGVGDSTTPVYLNANGELQTCTSAKDSHFSIVGSGGSAFIDVLKLGGTNSSQPGSLNLKNSLNSNITLEAADENSGSNDVYYYLATNNNLDNKDCRLVFVQDDNASTATIAGVGNSTTPVYVDSNGEIQACSAVGAPDATSVANNYLTYSFNGNTFSVSWQQLDKLVVLHIKTTTALETTGTKTFTSDNANANPPVPAVNITKAYSIDHSITFTTSGTFSMKVSGIAWNIDEYLMYYTT